MDSFCPKAILVRTGRWIKFSLFHAAIFFVVSIYFKFSSNCLSLQLFCFLPNNFQLLHVIIPAAPEISSIIYSYVFLPSSVPWILRCICFFTSNVCFCSKRPFAFSMFSKFFHPAHSQSSISSPMHYSPLVENLFSLSIGQIFTPQFLILLQILFFSSSTLSAFLQISLLSTLPVP